MSQWGSVPCMTPLSSPPDPPIHLRESFSGCNLGHDDFLIIQTQRPVVNFFCGTRNLDCDRSTETSKGTEELL